MRQLQNDFEDAVEKILPSVVVINIVRPSHLSDSDVLFQKHSPKNLGAHMEADSQGSGFIIRPNGYILTNWHVVQDARDIEVVLKNGDRYYARVVGQDEKTDLAVLHIGAENLPYATFSNAKVRVGDWAIAVGAPFNLEYTCTFGHISATNRSGLLQRTRSIFENYLQTDAAINPGNSGGPLCNLDGEVIGINTLIKGLDTRIGFAIPADMAESVCSELIACGHVTRPWIGVNVDSIDSDSDAREFLGSNVKGVLIRQVPPETPASNTLRPFDVVTTVDGHPVSSTQDFQRELMKKQIGELVELGVSRNGKPLRITLKTQDTPIVPVSNTSLNETVP